MHLQKRLNYSIMEIGQVVVLDNLIVNEVRTMTANEKLEALEQYLDSKNSNTDPDGLDILLGFNIYETTGSAEFSTHSNYVLQFLEELKKLKITVIGITQNATNPYMTYTVFFQA